MSELLGFKVGIHEIPQALSKYIREKASSHFSKLYFVPVVFPVFVMNPWTYAENFKDILRVRKIEASGHLTFDPVPEGEIWEVTNLTAYNDNSISVEGQIFDKTDTMQSRIEKKTIAAGLFWSGIFYLREGDYMNFTCGSGGYRRMYAMGVKRYA